MKVLKVVGIVIAALIVGVLALAVIIPVFLDSEYYVERRIVIDKPIAMVFHQAADYSERELWDPWIAIDPEAQNEFVVKNGYVGSTWKWQGDSIGTGSMTIVEVEAPTKIHSQLVFTAPMESQSDIYWTFTSLDSNRTEVVWANSGELGYMMRYMGLAMDQMLGASFEQGLQNLKQVTETKVDSLQLIDVEY
jgi:uncharacterized protein YndB with AHSA1/START domain